MCKTILIIDTEKLDETHTVHAHTCDDIKIPHIKVNAGDIIRAVADQEAYLDQDGNWHIRKCVGASGYGGYGKHKNQPQNDYVTENITYDLIGIMVEFAKILGIDINDPNMTTAKCTCPTECDCQDPDNGLHSTHCPTHNTNPYPNPDCPQHGMDGIMNHKIRTVKIN